MTPNEALQLLQDHKAILVDVREEEELLETGTAAGALWMPTSQMEEGEPAWESFKRGLPKDKQLILFCRSGNRSGRVAEILACAGFQTVNLGGFKEWKNAGLPVTPFSQPAKR